MKYKSFLTLLLSQGIHFVFLMFLWASAYELDNHDLKSLWFSECVHVALGYRGEIVQMHFMVGNINT